MIRNRATEKLINSVELDIETTQKLVKKLSYKHDSCKKLKNDFMNSYRKIRGYCDNSNRNLHRLYNS